MLLAGWYENCPLIVSESRDWLVCIGAVVQVISKLGTAGTVRLNPNVGEGMPCDRDLNYILLMLKPWGFQKCIWEP